VKWLLDLRIEYERGSVAEYGYTTLFEPMPEGGFNVIVPAIPEICTYGETLEEAREMAREAIRCYLESALKTGEPIPGDADISTRPSSTPALP
jgi:predicted RNase H-like HicB family nuclease